MFSLQLRHDKFLAETGNNGAGSAQSIDSSSGTLQSGGQMSLVSTGNVNLTSATVNAGSLSLQAGQNLILNTAVNTLDQVSDSGATRVSSTLGPLASINVTGNAAIVTGGNFEQDAGSLNVGGDLGMSIGGNWTLGVQQTGEAKVSIASGGDIDVTGSSIELNQGTAQLAAAGSVNIGAATQTQVDDYQETHSHSNVVSGKEVSSSGDTTTTLADGSTISADSVAISAGKDINVTGSAVVGTNNVSLSAANTVGPADRSGQYRRPVARSG